MNISSTDSFWNFKVSGSKAYEEYVKFKHLTVNHAKKVVCMPPPEASYYYNYLKENPYSAIASYVLFSFAGRASNKDDLKLAKTFYDELPTSGKKSYFGERVKAIIDKESSLNLILAKFPPAMFSFKFNIASM